MCSIGYSIRKSMDGNIIGRWINVETVRLYDGDMIAYIVFISKQALGPD